MHVIKEETNKYDPWAMTVVMPRLEKIDRLLHDKITRPGDSKRSEQTVADIAGRVIGRVPANFCRALCQLKDANIIVGDILCHYEGEARVSKHVPVQQTFQRKRRPAFDTQGLKCTYVFEIPSNEYYRVRDIFDSNIPKHELNKIQM